jgi:hypothetical protein
MGDGEPAARAVSDRLRRARQRRAELAADPQLAALEAARRARGRPLQPLSDAARELERRIVAAGLDGLPLTAADGPEAEELRARGRIADTAAGRAVHQDVLDEAYDEGRPPA